MILRFESDAGIRGRQRWSAELATVRDAQIQAIQTLGQLLSEDGSQFWVEEEVSMTVSDEGGLTISVGPRGRQVCRFPATARVTALPGAVLRQPPNRTPGSDPYQVAI